MLAFWTYGRSQKIVNLRRDPRITCLVEDGEDYFELRGVSDPGQGPRWSRTTTRSAPSAPGSPRGWPAERSRTSATSATRSSTSRHASGSASSSSRTRSPAGTTARWPASRPAQRPDGGSMKKIKVDFDLCESNAMCEALAPDALPGRRRRLPADPRRERHRRGPRRASSRPSPPARSRRSASSEELTQCRSDDPSPATAGSPSSPAPAPGLGRAEALALAARRRRGRAQRPARSRRRGRRGDPRRSAARPLVVRRRRGGARHRRRHGARRPLEKLGGLDIVVNNAGITRDKMLFNMTDEEFDLVLKVHLRGHFLLSRNAAAYWRGRSKETGEPVDGRGRQHRLRGVPRRLARPGELRRGQGRHHRADAVDGPRAVPDRACAPTRSARAPAPR